MSPPKNVAFDQKEIMGIKFVKTYPTRSQLLPIVGNRDSNLCQYSLWSKCRPIKRNWLLLLNKKVKISLATFSIWWASATLVTTRAIPLYLPLPTGVPFITWFASLKAASNSVSWIWNRLKSIYWINCPRGLVFTGSGIPWIISGNLKSSHCVLNRFRLTALKMDFNRFLETANKIFFPFLYITFGSKLDCDPKWFVRSHNALDGKLG